MESIKLQAQKREGTGSKKATNARREGMVPAVLYGHGAENALLSVSLHDLDIILHHGTRVLELVLGNSAETAMIKEVQYDAMGDRPIHVDFVRVAADERITVEIPVVLVGTAPGTATGGILDHPVADIEIECLATQVPENIRVSIRELQIGDFITVGQLTVPEGVKILTDPELLVATVHPPAKEEEAAAAPAAEGEAPAEPEVIGAKEREERQAEKEAKSE